MSNFHIPLNGSNHISKERHKAFEEALNDKHVIKCADEAGNEAQNIKKASTNEISQPNTAEIPAARNEKRTGNGKSVSPDLVKGIEMSLNQSFAHQNRTMDIHQKYLDQQEDYAQIIREILNQQGKILDNGNPESLKEIIVAFQRSLDNFHKMREKGMAVHQQFLAQQTDFSQSFVRVLEKQHGLDHGVFPGSNTAFTETTADPVASPSSKKTPLEFVVNPDPVVIDYQPNIEETTGTQHALPAGPTISPEILAEALLRIVGEKTGYPPEMLELEMDLEADLGIDSIKRVEILGALEEEFPSLPQADTEILSQTRTLKEIVDYLKSEAGQSSEPVREAEAEAVPSANAETPIENPIPDSIQEKAVNPPVTEGHSAEKLTSILLEIVAEKTGYPAEMLELGMDLEADLGIDSIKRVEILGAMEDRVPGLPQVETETLAELRTLEEIVSMMSSAQNSPLSRVDEGSELKKKVDQSPLETTPVKLTSLPRADFLEFEISPEHPIILTDEGTDFTLQLANRLIKEGWKVLLWNFAGMDHSRKEEINPEIIQIKAEEPSAEALKDQLKALRNQFGAFSGFIHLHPSSELVEVQPELERDLIKTVFLLAGALKDDLTAINESGRSIFLTVTRTNGKLGLDPVKDFQEGSGLTGVVKTLSWEWPDVFTRAIDLDLDMNIQEHVECVIQEIHDPDRGLVEVGLTRGNRYTIEREGLGTS
jgi:acyl carrier protein